MALMPVLALVASVSAATDVTCVPLPCRDDVESCASAPNASELFWQSFAQLGLSDVFSKGVHLQSLSPFGEVPPSSQPTLVHFNKGNARLAYEHFSILNNLGSKDSARTLTRASALKEFASLFEPPQIDINKGGVCQQKVYEASNAGLAFERWILPPTCRSDSGQSSDWNELCCGEDFYVQSSEWVAATIQMGSKTEELMTLDSEFWAAAQALPAVWDEQAYTSFVKRFGAFIPKTVNLRRNTVSFLNDNDTFKLAGGSEPEGPDGCLNTTPVSSSLEPISTWFRTGLLTSESWPYQLSDSHIANLDRASEMTLKDVCASEFLAKAQELNARCAAATTTSTTTDQLSSSLPASLTSFKLLVAATIASSVAQAVM